MGTNNFPHESIAKMGPWDFWAHPSSIDVEPADEPFLTRPMDAIPPGSRERIQRAVYKACADLRDAEVGLPCGKPS